MLVTNRIIIGLTVLLYCGGSGVAISAPKGPLLPPFELQWGATPDAVANLMSRIMRPLSESTMPPQPADGSPTNPAAPAAPGGVSGLFVAEQHYEGEIFAAKAERITPAFFMGQLFAIAASFPSAPDTPASLVWERLVDQVMMQYGKPRFRSKPVPLLSWNAVLQVVPPDANRSGLLSIYNEANRDPKNGQYILQDLQVQTGLWVPEAFWNFPGGGVIKVVMRAGGRTEKGLTGIKPLLLILKHDMVL